LGSEISQEDQWHPSLRKRGQKQQADECEGAKARGARRESARCVDYRGGGGNGGSCLAI
jgi:hypothetical protein